MIDFLLIDELHWPTSHNFNTTIILPLKVLTVPSHPQVVKYDTESFLHFRLVSAPTCQPRASATWQHTICSFNVTALLAHLFRGKDWDEILIYLTDLLLNHSLIGLIFELLTGKPEHHILLAELCPQELAEAAATRRTFHHLFKWRGPGASVFQSRPQTERGTTVDMSCCFILSVRHSLWWRPAEMFLKRVTGFSQYLSSQLMVPSVVRSQVDFCIVSSSLLTVKLEGKKTHNETGCVLIHRP